MVEAYKKMWVNAFNFKDRTTRKDFWSAFLMNMIVAFAIGFVTGLIGNSTLMLLGYLYPIAIIIPGLAMEIRRIHDIDKSGWYILIILIPVVGEILFFIALCTASKECNRGVQL